MSDERLRLLGSVGGRGGWPRSCACENLEVDVWLWRVRTHYRSLVPGVHDPHKHLRSDNSYTMSGGKPKPASSSKSRALYPPSLKHGLLQATAIAASPSAPHVVASAWVPAIEPTPEAKKAVSTIACVRSILVVAKEALEACPIDGPKAAVGALAEVLKMVQVRSKCVLR
jgi:hypothetical protein